MQSWLQPLYDAAGMRSADAWAIDERGVPSLELMEAAGTALADAALEVARPGPARVVCGKGNNGGDGLVAARRLADAGLEVETLLVWPSAELSGDAEVNLGRLSEEPKEVGAAEITGALQGSGVVVDAIFGTGFEGAPRSPAEEAIDAITASDAPVVAADIASGVDASTGRVDGAAVEAQVTVTFHAPKLGHWIAPGKWHTGELRVAQIGIPSGAPAKPSAGLISARVLADAPRRDAHSTKFTSGQVLVVGGSRGLTGAVCLSATAATRAGAGYATVAVPGDLEAIFEAKLTEVMSFGCPGPGGRLGPEAAEPILEQAERAAAVVLGPGLGRSREAFALARIVAAKVTVPLVVDADALNAHAGELAAFRVRSAPTILTPHAGELGRLLERESDEISARRLESAREAAEAAGAILILKGDDTLVVDPGGDLAVNGLASPALATAGTGDVLTGILAALLARGMDPFGATCAGVHLHAAAGRIAAEDVGATESVIAGDVIHAIPPVLGDVDA